MPGSPDTSRTSLAFHNLRGVVILIVVAFHSALAYLQWIPVAGSGFDQPPYDWRAFPIIDSHRFFGFDLFCAWQDVDLMSLMFLLSGLFVWPSLMRKGDAAFLRDRILRLGLPYAFGIAIVIPLAVYPAYRVTAADPGLPAYWHALLALPFWPNGPLWFIWQLLALNFIAAAVHRFAPGAIPALARWTATADRNLVRYFAVLLAVSAIAYVPLAVLCTPWAWSNSGLFAVQFCRPLHYAVYFFAGIGIGAAGIDRGLVAAGGVLARRWAWALAAALISLFVWMGLTALTMNGPASIGLDIAAASSFVLACAAGSFCFIAVCLRFATAHWRIVDFLAVNAYAVYLVHYVFIVWLQFALLDMPLFALVKAAIVFGGTLALSLFTIFAVQRIPLGARLLGAVPRPVTAA
jgi:surface polysaccharide O-acyltransferase-like enzyme